MAGLVNLGHVCYVNVVFQSLSNCQELHMQLSQHFNMHAIPDPSRICPRCTIYHVMTQMLLPPDSPLGKDDLQPLYDALTIDVNQTGDPREFLVDFLRKDFPEFQIYFGFGLQTDINCQSCKQTFSRLIDQVELEISSTCKTLQEGVTKYLAIEELESYDCQICENYVDAYLERRMTSNPSYLVLHRSGAKPIDLSFVIKINKEEYLLDSFIEYIPPRTKRYVGHYISFKKVNQVWLTYDNSVCRKASMMGSFCVNLAFYRNVSKSLTVPYSLDFAKIKSLRGRKRPNVSMPTEPLKPKKSCLEALEDYFNEESKLGKSCTDVPSGFSEEQDAPLLVSERDQPQPGTSKSQLEVDRSCTNLGKTTVTSLPLTSDLGLVISNITSLSPDLTDDIQNFDLQQIKIPNTCDTKPEETLEPSIQTTNENPHMSEETTPNQATLHFVGNTDPSTSQVSNTLERIPEQPLSIPQLDIPNTYAEDSTHPNEKNNKDISQGGGMSAANMPPLKLNRRLVVDCERYVNLLKHFQEGKVHVKTVKSTDDRLTNIKTKSIPQSLFEKFYTETDKSADNLKTLAENEHRPTESEPAPSEHSDNEDRDESDTDPDYKPPVDDVVEDTVETPKKRKKKKATRTLSTKSTRSTPYITRRLTRIGSKKSSGNKTHSNKDVIPVRKNVRRDGVDERHRGEKYVRWEGEKGPGLHRSHIDDSLVLIDYLPPFQIIGENCSLCPQEKILNSEDETIKHYRSVHISRLINIHQINILMCRCSEVHSRGSDNTVRNRHYHCIECWHPIDTKVKLRVHVLSKHSELYTLSELQHWAPTDKKKKKKK